MSDKKKRENARNNLTTAQEVTYRKEFKAADRAGGYAERR